MARDTGKRRGAVGKKSSRRSESTTTKKKKGGGRGFYRGNDAMRQMEREEKHQEQRKKARQASANNPFRFYVKVGDTREIVILDDKPDFFMYEHCLKNPATGRYDLYTGCVRDWDNCPVCEKDGKESYYGMYLTILDLTPYETSSGETVEFSRKLMVVKSGQQKKFIRRYEKEGTLRGAIFEMSRDSDKSPSIGNDIEFLEFMDESELEGYVRTYKDREGKKHTEDCSVPYEYEEMFEEPDSEALAELVGAEPTPGSRKANRRSSRDEDEDFDEEEEEAPWDEEEGEEEGEEEEEEERSSRRGSSRKGSSRGSARSARSSSRRSRDEEEEEEEPEEEEEEDRGTRRRGSARSTRSSSRGSSRRGGKR